MVVHTDAAIAEAVATATATAAVSVGLNSSSVVAIASTTASVVVNELGGDAGAAAKAAASAEITVSSSLGSGEISAEAHAGASIELSLLNNTVLSALSSAHVAASTVLDMGGALEVAAEVAATAAVSSAENAILAVSAGAVVSANTTHVVSLELAASAAVVAALVASESNMTAVAEIVASVVVSGDTPGGVADLGASVQVSDTSLDALSDLGLPMECGVPPMPDHGIGLGLAWATNVVGTVASFECRIGYYLAGSHRRVCRSDHLWSGEATFCIATTPSPTPSITLPPTPVPTPSPTAKAHCLTPYEIPHGSISATGGNVWDQAFFECFPPYVRLGPRTATCKENARSSTGAAWTLFPVCAKDVKTCSHIKCAMRMHSQLFKVSMQVDHARCSRTRIDPHPLAFSGYAYECEEQHGDMHHCEIEQEHQQCVCKCWHKEQHPAPLAQEDLAWSGAMETP